MKQHSKRFLPHFAALAVSGLVLSSSALAGLVAEATTTQGGESQSMTIEAEDGALARINFPQQDGVNYMLIRDGNLYMVTNQQGETVVMDMADFFRLAETIGGAAVPELAADDIASVISLDDTGRDEVVAGIEGDVYDLAWRDGEGNEQRAEAVLSSDPRARAFTLVWSNLVQGMTNAVGSDAAPDDLRARLDREGKGFLRMGDQFTLTDLHEEDFPSGHFELPGPVMEMSSLFSGAGTANPPASDADAAAATEEEGGMFGGIFNRQRDRAAERSQQRAEEETQSAVDEAVERGIRGLFGR